MNEQDAWRDIFTRARVLFAQARSGAGADELDRLSGHDPAVVVAAIAYGEGRRADRRGDEPDDVADRLRELLPSFRLQAV